MKKKMPLSSSKSTLYSMAMAMAMLTKAKQPRTNRIEEKKGSSN
jgi:hypothetical protein